jgi:hypothetical protein
MQSQIDAKGLMEDILNSYNDMSNIIFATSMLEMLQGWRASGTRAAA